MKPTVVRWDDAPDLLTVDELAALLRVNRNTAYEAVRAGVVPSIRLGRKIRVPKWALKARLEGRSDERREGDGAE